jgi:hypothetical protein
MFTVKDIHSFVYKFSMIIEIIGNTSQI